MTRARYLIISGLVLVISLAITLLLSNHERRNAERNFHATLDFSLRESASKIEQRMAAYEQMLRGVQGFLVASDQISPARFRAYIDSLQPSADSSGVHGVGRIAIVPDAELETHTAAVREAGFPDYRVYPSDKRGVHTPIVQVEPFIGDNIRTLGFDPSSDPARQKAMRRAVDSGSASITRKVLLASEDKDSTQAGCVMYLPLYRRGARLDTPAQRREALTGWVFAFFRIGDLMASLYGESRSNIDILLHDSIERSAESVLYDSGKASAQEGPEEASEYLSLGGVTWVLTVRSRPDFDSAYRSDQSNVIQVAGVLLSALLALICWQMLAGRSLAMALAVEMTDELRKSEERARHLAQHDSLTGLSNRALFFDRLSQALSLGRRDGTPLALMFIDLDSFKSANDDFGHDIGDALLRAVATRMHEAVRESDTVGRFGGDEFVVLLPVIKSKDDALRVATKIRDVLAHPFTLGGHLISTSASIGVAIFPDHGDDEISLNKSADQAMYRAKDGGGNRIEWAV